MKAEDYNTGITIDAGVKEAFNAINNVYGWWSTDFEGSVNKQGDVFTVHFGDTFITMQIIELIPDRKVVWQVIDSWKHWMKSNNTEWIGTKISFEILEKEDKAQVEFTHVGLVPALDCFDVCSDAWGDYIKNSLRNLINSGVGQPTNIANSEAGVKK